MRPALLIIDMFSRFDFPDGARLAPLAARAARQIARLRNAFDGRGWPVIYANDNFGDWKSGLHALADVCRHQEGPTGEIAARLYPRPDHYVILKPKHSAFLATPLSIVLGKLEVGHLMLTGMALDSCVLATAIDANSREFHSVVVSDATAVLPERRPAALRVLRATGGVEVRTTRTVLSALAADGARSGR